jgi:transcription elongation GreA/GreB family factor
MAMNPTKKQPKAAAASEAPAASKSLDAAATSKAALRAELLAQLQEAAAAAVAAHQATVAGATHEEAKSEGDKDTRATEQQYLARGQAQRVVELEEAVAEVTRWSPRAFAAGDAIGLGALVTVDEDGTIKRLLVAPAGGGNTLAGGVAVVTPRSPLGQALLGKRAGDVAELRGRELEITLIQ